MRKVKYKANYGYAGTDVEDELEYPDGATDEEIEKGTPRYLPRETCAV